MRLLTPVAAFLATLLLLLRLSASLNQEGLYLLQAKKGLDDPSAALSKWNLRDSTPCNWTGVTCSLSRSGSGSGSSSSELTVTSLDFYNFNLTGPFPSALCRLPNLRFLSFSFNYINSTLDDAAISGCTALEHLDLSENLLVGSLPDALAALPALTHLNLMSNSFSGAIPSSFGRFPRIRELSLVNNLLNSTIPGFLANLSTLQHLNLSYNPFDAGPIPAELGNLASLKVLWLAGCNLVGKIPLSLGKLSMLTDLDLSTNRLSGPIPEAIVGNLTSAVQIELYNNSLTGRFPVGLGGLPALLSLDASTNLLEGPLPEDIFDAPRLDSIHLYSNRLTGGIPSGISRSATLTDVRLFGNQLSGALPADLGKNSPLVNLDLSTNHLSGEIPASICDRGVLEELLLLDNSFSGSLPDGLRRCRTLLRIRLRNNRLSGEIPSGLWGLPHLIYLELKGNMLSGGISPAISGAANMLSLLLDDNQFSGSIPSEVGSLSNLEVFSVANNRLSGPLPASLGSLSALGRLVLCNNSLSGELLRGIKSWQKLNELNLAHNDFTGRIPPELGSLPVLNYLDLSGNILTGEIPAELQNLKLNLFNLSNNELSGKLPPFFASEAYRDSFLGNPGLCGDLPGLCPVSQGDKKHHSFIWLLMSIFLLAALILGVGVGWFCWRYQKFKKVKMRINKSKWTLTSFHKIEFGEYEIMDCLDEDNVIGSGASGKVYKAVLSNGEIVAVKKLWGGSKEGGKLDQAVEDAFEAEVATLGKIRHKNIVKLWCSCTHKDCKLLVYEYMPNGSLGDLLHGSKGGLLDWPTRYKIVLDAAEGLSYLHHDCVPAIVHRDVKSNNILLDGEYGARVADFGVAKAVEVVGKGTKSMSVIAGSCGYIAPEYAYTLRVNEKSDIYSFGVVILELVTGKPPIDPAYGEKDLVKWVCGTMEQKGIDHLIDPKLDLCYKEEIHKVLTIGLLCVSSLPINRPSMRRVVKMLQEVGKEDKMKSEKGGKLSPYYSEDASDQGSIV